MLRRIVLVVFVLLLCGGGIPLSRAHARVGGPDVYVSFRADLAPYGEWFEYGSYGWVWRPVHVHRGWRPYVDGHWVLTDFGWTWVADEPWGWAPFHYGRWFYDDAYGWAWVPGDEWAPAWVSWRSGAGFIGWAPLPPWATWSVGVGFVGDVWIRPAGYCFVEDRFFIAPHVASHVVSLERNVTLIKETRNITSYGTVNGRIAKRSLDPRQVERAVGHPIAQRRVEALRAAAPRPLRAAGREEPARAAARERGREGARTVEGSHGRARAPEARRGGHENATAGPQRHEHNRAAAATPRREEHGRASVTTPRHAEQRRGEGAAQGRHEHGPTAKAAPAEHARRHAAAPGREQHVRKERASTTHAHANAPTTHAHAPAAATHAHAPAAATHARAPAAAKTTHAPRASASAQRGTRPARETARSGAERRPVERRAAERAPEPAARAPERHPASTGGVRHAEGTVPAVTGHRQGGEHQASRAVPPSNRRSDGSSARRSQRKPQPGEPGTR